MWIFLGKNGILGINICQNTDWESVELLIVGYDYIKCCFAEYKLSSCSFKYDKLGAKLSPFERARLLRPHIESTSLHCMQESRGNTERIKNLQITKRPERLRFVMSHKIVMVLAFPQNHRTLEIDFQEKLPGAEILLKYRSLNRRFGSSIELNIV